MLRGLVKNIEDFGKNGLAPDLVAVTGDIADRALPAEYAIAERWFREHLLPVTGIAADRLLLVPGNHDVDRGAVKMGALALQDALLKGQDQEAIAMVLGDPDERGTLLRRHTGWVEFAMRFRAQQLDLPWWSDVFEIRGTKLHVTGFCSSWISWSDADKGQLLLGRWQVHTLLAGADEADLSVALMHHPWDYLAEFDAAEVREAVQRRCALVLSGHRHRQGGQAASRPGGGVLELAAGCCYGGSKWPN
ncbi:MAG: metallophosphoesterase, partial [Acidobacteria bacterium]|nr:metallophosphoesterase [Acidobacteriota bacterium]